MNDRIQETLSAMVDGEADELEVRRALKHCEHDVELYQRWESYQLIGSILRNESIGAVDIASKVRAALDGHEHPIHESDMIVAQEQEPSHSVSRWRRRMVSGSIAASVTFAVLVGVQWQSLNTTSDSQPLAATEIEVVTSEHEQYVALEDEQQLKEAQQRLQKYVLEHSDQAYGYSQSGLLPFMPLMQNANYQSSSAQ